MTETPTTPSTEAPQPEPVQSAAPPASPQPAQEATRPEWLPSKFKDGAQLAAAYSELEKRLGSQQPAQETPSQGAPTPTAPGPAEENAVRAAGLDPVSIEVEFMDTGKVSAETYAKAAKVGLSKEFVDSYVQGRAAVAQQQTAALYAEVGGEAEFGRIAAWAKVNLSAREIQALNQATQNGSLEMAKIALRGIASRYQAAVGRDPALVAGDAADTAAGFRSQDEVMRAMRDPRYAKDPAYRAAVEARLRAGSPFNARAVGR